MQEKSKMQADNEQACQGKEQLGSLLEETSGLNEAEEWERSRKSKMKRRPLAWDDAKIEIAKELGLWQKVEVGGWAGLTAEESGRLGGILSKRFPGKAPKEAVKSKKRK